MSLQSAIDGVVSRSLEVRPPETAEETELYYDLRWRLLRQPWSKDRGTEVDSAESTAIHMGAWLGRTLVGVGRLHFIDAIDAQVRFMAVEPSFQGQHIGSAILEELERRARQAGRSHVVLNAREGVLAFYRRRGYSVIRKCEDPFPSGAHWEMHKTL